MCLKKNKKNDSIKKKLFKIYQKVFSFIFSFYIILFHISFIIYKDLKYIIKHPSFNPIIKINVSFFFFNIFILNYPK
jgi:hypothetical protein